MSGHLLPSKVEGVRGLLRWGGLQGFLLFDMGIFRGYAGRSGWTPVLSSERRERLANQTNNDLQIRLFGQLSSARVVLMGRNMLFVRFVTLSVMK